MSCQQVPTAPAFNPYPRSVQVGEFDVATDGGIWVAIGALNLTILKNPTICILHPEVNKFEELNMYRKGSESVESVSSIGSEALCARHLV